MMLCSPAGGDLLYNNSLPEQGRNFSNKIWNAFRLTQSWEVDSKIEQPLHSKVAIKWFNHKFNEQIKQLDKLYDTYKLSDALMLIYKLFRDEFSSWLLEAVKPDYQKPIDQITYNEITEIFDRLLKILHPFMPFITEEIWHLLNERKTGESIMISKMPSTKEYDSNIIENFNHTKETITQLRNIRKEKNLPYKTKLKLLVKDSNNNYSKDFESILMRLGGLDSITDTDQKEKGAIHFVVKKTEFFVPLKDFIDKDVELKKLTEELEYTKGFLTGVMKKLSNKRFVDNAPAQVIEKENIKKADAEAKIIALEDQIKTLEN